jgi:hypothetical protein
MPSNGSIIVVAQDGGGKSPGLIRLEDVRLVAGFWSPDVLVLLKGCIGRYVVVIGCRLGFLVRVKGGTTLFQPTIVAV